MTSLNHNYKLKSTSKDHFLGCVLYMGASCIGEFTFCIFANDTEVAGILAQDLYQQYIVISQSVTSQKPYSGT